MPMSAGDGWYPDPDVDGNKEWSVGRHVRIMCDEGGVPLWDEKGRLPEEPEFLTDFLGLSATLIADLTAWAEEERKLQRGDRAAGAAVIRVAPGHRLSSDSFEFTPFGGSTPMTQEFVGHVVETRR